MGSREANEDQQVRVELLTTCQKTSVFFQPASLLLMILYEHC